MATTNDDLMEQIEAIGQALRFLAEHFGLDEMDKVLQEFF